MLHKILQVSSQRLFQWVTKYIDSKRKKNNSLTFCITLHAPWRLMYEMSPSENLYGGQFTLNIYIKPNYPLPPDVAAQFM